MKKYRGRLLALLLSFTVLLSTVPAMSLTASAADGLYSGGNGTEEDPYQISSREDLEVIAEAVNGGNDLKGLYFKQTGNIDMGGADEDPFPVIGHVIANAPHPFNGVYDGGDYSISGLYVYRKDDDAGLFGYVGPSGVVRRVHVVDCDISGSTYVGGVAGRNYGLVEYCSSSGEVHGSWQYAGGIVGDNLGGGKISYCYSDCDVLGNQFVGGIAGSNSCSTIENCYFRGYAYAKSNVRSYVGGIVGENRDNGIVDNCYSDGEVEGNQYYGAIAGSSGLGSTVQDCYYPEEFEEDGLPGIGDNKGTAENVTPKTDEQFASGEVAWELSNGTNGDGWGQNLGTDGIEADAHPHFLYAPDKPNDTSAVYRVTFKSNYNSINEVLYVDPGVDVELPDLANISEYAKWYVLDKSGLFVIGEDGLPVEFDGLNIQNDVDAFAGERILFAGETDTIIDTVTYSTEPQTLDLDLYMVYADRGPSSYGRFDYKIVNDQDSLNASLSDDGKTLIIPACANVKEGGYTLEILAHEKTPYIVPLAITPFAVGSYGTSDVTLTVNIVIEKATPVITVKPEASTIDYGDTLENSTLKGGEAQHPATAAKVDGTFTWDTVSTAPAVTEAAITGYSVTFTPNDTRNYNNAYTTVTLDVNKLEPTNVIAPTPKNGIYNGSAQALIEEGSAEGGTMKYWLADDTEAEAPDPNAEYSSTIPSRANVGTYKIWYKVIGDENHKDTEPNYVIATIAPYPLTITDQHFTYNGGNTLTLTLDGVNVDGEEANRTVVATLTAYTQNAGVYSYATEAGEGKYTVDLSNSNYIVADGAGTLTIDKLAAVFSWSDTLTFTYDGDEHVVTATVSNAITGDEFKLEYKENSESQEGDYTAQVTELGNDNYTLENAQNATQAWYITPESESLTLSADDQITYGDEITLIATVAPITIPVANTVIFNGRIIHLTSVSAATAVNAAADTVDFYANGNLIDSVEVIYDDDGKDSGTATLTIDATTANYLSAGVNAVKAEYGGNGNVTSAESTALTVTVSAKPLTVTIDGNTVKTYDGNNVAIGFNIALNDEQICENGSNDNGKDDVSVTADTYTYNSANVEEANIITANNVTLVGAQSSNYVIDNEPVTIDGKIDPKTVGLEWRGATGLVYTGDKVNVNATAIELIPGDECRVNVEKGQEISVGDYIAEAISLDNSNYALPTVGTTQAYTINPARLFVPEKIVPYDGNEKFEVEADGVTKADGTTEKVKVNIIASSPNAGSYAYGAAITRDVDEKTYISSIDDTNYELAGGAMLIIEKIAPEYISPTANVLTYNEDTQELVTAGETADGTMKYSLSQDGDYSEMIPVGTDAGDYTVWYKVFGDMNHTDTEPQAVPVTINKADPIVEPPTAKKTLRYNGTSQELVTAGYAYGGELLYSLSEDGPYSSEIPTGIEDSTYTVWYMVIGDSNHNNTIPQSVEVTIAPIIPDNESDDNSGNEPGGDPGEDPGENPSDEPTDDPGENPGEDPGEDSGENPSDEPSDDPGENPGEDPGEDSGENPSDEPSDDPGDNPGEDPGEASGESPSDEPSDEPSDNPGDEPGDDHEEDIDEDSRTSSNDKTENDSVEPSISIEAEPDSGSDSRHNGNSTSPKTGADMLAFSMLILSMLAFSGVKLTALRKSKKSK